jgi:hypothetical protein
VPDADDFASATRPKKLKLRAIGFTIEIHATTPFYNSTILLPPTRANVTRCAMSTEC